MNGAVDTRSNWKGLNAGLREVPSMVAIAFARGWKVKMCGTRAKRVRGRVAARESVPICWLWGCREPTLSRKRLTHVCFHRGNWREKRAIGRRAIGRDGHRGCRTRPFFWFSFEIRMGCSLEKRKTPKKSRHRGATPRHEPSTGARFDFLASSCLRLSPRDALSHA